MCHQFEEEGESVLHDFILIVHTGMEFSNECFGDFFFLT